MLSTESSLDVANGGNVTLYSLCACHGGCGVPSNPPVLQHKIKLDAAGCVRNSNRATLDVQLTAIA